MTWMTPDVVALLKEFLDETSSQTDNEKTRAHWIGRADLVNAMRLYCEQTPTDEVGTNSFNKKESDWMKEATTLFRDGRFWQFALFRTCARRAIARIDKIAEEQGMTDLTALPGFGVF